MKKSFTMLELVIVTVIVAVLAGIGLSRYSGARSKVFSKDAEAQLRLILQTEAMYKLESGSSLIACNATTPCSTALGMMALNMQQGRTYCVGISNPNNICASAHTPNGANYSMNSSVNLVYPGDCPAPCW